MTDQGIIELLDGIRIRDSLACLNGVRDTRIIGNKSINGLILAICMVR